MASDEKTKRCQELVAQSKEVIRESFRRFDPATTGITWTGGKDSTTNLWLMRQVCLEDNIDLPIVMTIDEGDAFPEITDFLVRISQKWHIDLEWLCNFDVLSAAAFEQSQRPEVHPQAIVNSFERVLEVALAAREG